MKTALINKKIFLSLPVLLLVAGVLTFNSCKKSSTDNGSDDGVAATDQAAATTAMNSAVDDADYVAGNVASVSGTSGGSFDTVANATIDTTAAATSPTHTITIVYSGLALHSLTLTRTGTVTINLVYGSSWSSAGAILAINFNNVVYSDGVDSITLNGTHYLTNVNGGLAWKIIAGIQPGTVTHKHTATNFTITFANGTQKTWSVSRTRTYTNASGVRTVTVIGDSTVNGQANVDIVGTNRNGDAFVNSINTDISVDNVCGWLRPYVGEDSQKVANRSLTILYGTNSAGVAESSGCPGYYKITYTAKGVTKTLIAPYLF